MGAAGAYYGAYDLIYKTCQTMLYPVLSRRINRRKGNKGDVTVSKHANQFGFMTGMASGVGFVAVRELFFLPHTPPAPQLPVDDRSLSLRIRLQNAWAMARHSIQHYPYKFRTINVFVAGALAGIAHLGGELYYYSNMSEEGEKNKESAAQNNTESQQQKTGHGYEGSNSAGKKSS